MTTTYVPNLTDTPKVGDIWLSTWGYEACLATWFVVTKVTGKMIGLAEIGADETGNWVGGTSTPHFPIAQEGATKMHKVKDTAYGPRVKINSYSSASPWAGKSVETYNHH